MRSAQRRDPANGSSSQISPVKSISTSSKPQSKADSSSTGSALGNGKAAAAKAIEVEEVIDDDLKSQADVKGKRKVGVLPLVEGALEVGDDGRAIVWLDIDNTLYSKGTDIAHLMTARIRAYIIGLGLEQAEAERLHQKYYKEYGLAIRGLVMHHKIDALDYDAKCDATLPLEDVLKPDERIKAMLRDLDRSKCRVWALTNAYKTHAIRVLKLLEVYDQIEGVIYCDYSQERFACKPEKEFYDEAMQVVGLQDPSRCFFVDDSSLNIEAAKKLGWGHCVLFDEVRIEADEKEWSEDKEQSKAASLNSTVLGPNGSTNSSLAAKGGFDVEMIQKEFRKLPQHQRVELLHIILDACLPGDIVSMTKTLEKHLRLTKDMISNLPEDVCLRIFEKLEVKELLNCQSVSKKWNAIAANPMLWKSHALGLTEGDPVALVPPSTPSGWEPLVRGLYFRERNWSNGICQNLTLMKGHTGFVTAMKLKGRKTLVTGSYDETIRVWDLHTGACKKVLTAKAIACLDFLSEEGILAAGLYDSGRVMVWDMKTWSLLQTLSGHNRGIRNVALNQDYLVSVGQDKAIVVWDWQKGVKIVRFGQQSNVSLGVSIVDHDKIVAVTVDGIIRTFSIRKKEMIGQFDLTKLSSSLASQLSGLKGGTVMLQWFAAHRNTITLASHNLVIHLQWQEHIVPVRKQQDKKIIDSTPQRSRTRADSTASNMSNASNATSRSASQKKPSAATSTTPVKASTTRTVTPSRLQSPANNSQRGSPAPLSPSPWPRPATGARTRTSLTPSTSISTTSLALSSANKAKEEGKPTTTPSPTTPTSSTADTSSSTPQQTRIAPNLTVAPVIVDILQTPDAAAGCVDPAKKRIVLASRFISRTGADRRIYTSTLEGGSSSSKSRKKASDEVNGEGSDLTDNERKVVAIGGAWQANAEESATPARNPMSLVLDHENCVVGTSEGIVYRMGFVGSEYTKGWVEEEAGEAEHEGKAGGIRGNFTGGSGTITNLLQLRSMWKDLFT